VGFALLPGSHTSGKGGDLGGVGRAAHTGALTRPRAADAAGNPMGMRQLGWRSSAVGVLRHRVPGDPRGWKAVLLRHGFRGGMKMDVSRQAQLEHGPSWRTGSAFPSVPGCVAGATRFQCDHQVQARSCARIPGSPSAPKGEALLAAFAV